MSGIDIYKTAEVSPTVYTPLTAWLLCSRYEAVRSGNPFGAYGITLAYGNTIRSVTRRAKRTLARIDARGADVTPVRSGVAP